MQKFPDPQSMPLTVAEALHYAALPRLEARLLLTHASTLSQVAQVTHPESLLPEDAVQRFVELLKRRHAGEPIAYLLGIREFYGAEFYVSPAVLIPRPETELLVDVALACLPQGGRLLDLGTGSGAVALTVARLRPDVVVTALEVSDAALAVAQDNAQRLDMVARCHFLRSDWYSALPAQQFDVIVSNPPYIAQGDMHLQQGDLQFEPQQALTDQADGLACIRHIVAGAGPYLTATGWLLFEHGYDQGAASLQLLAEAGFSARETRQDLAGLDRVSLGRRSAI